MKKKLWLLLSLVFCLVVMAGCSNSKASEKVELTEELTTTIKSNVTQNFEQWVGLDFQSVYEDTTLEDDVRTQYKNWGDLRDKLGELRSESEPTLDISKDGVTGKIKGEFDNGKIEMSLGFDLSGNYVNNSISVNEEESMGQIMEKALLNTLMGMGTVFLILILISLVISSFGLIGKQQAKKAAQKASQSAPVQPVVMAPVMEEQADVTDDLELVAVVTAAIMASMGDEAPAEGLVVRSIKKRNASKWKNA